MNEKNSTQKKTFDIRLSTKNSQFIDVVLMKRKKKCKMGTHKYDETFMK